MNVEKFGKKIRAKIAEWQARYIPCSLDEEEGKERYIFLCHHHERSRKQDRIIRKEMAQLVASFFYENWEKEWLQQKLQKHLPPVLVSESEKIGQCLFTKCQAQESWLRKLSEQLETYLQEEYCLAIDGYLRFRFQAYHVWLDQTIKEVIDEYILDREYKEFIQLLKYFISVQTPKYSLVHVIHQEKNHFQMLSEDGVPLQLNEMDQSLQEMIELTFSHEDLIVSALLTTAPEQVVLHTQFTNENVIRTLLQIFEERISICSGCARCERIENSQGDR